METQIESYPMLDYLKKEGFVSAKLMESGNGWFVRGIKRDGTVHQIPASKKCTPDTKLNSMSVLIADDGQPVAATGNWKEHDSVEL